MILRKPYAFLIKHFKLIHMIITFLLVMIAFRSRSIYLYLNQVINSSVMRYEALNYVQFGIYIYIFLSLILMFVIYWLLKYKNKPKRLYIISISSYIIIAVFLYILFVYLRTFVNLVPDTKTIRLYRDIMLLMLLSQYLLIVVMLIRGLGFDIKKFNFASDVQELNATSVDSEEIEINTKIDTTNIVRNVRKKQREFGYFFKEFKVYIIAIISVVLVVAGIVTYNKLSDKFKVYHPNEMIGNINQIMIRQSYFYTDGERNYIIVEFDISKYGRSERFNVSSLALLIGKEKYTPDKNVCSKFNYLGTCYKKQYITNKSASYIVTYSVENLNIQNAYILYTDSYEDTYKVKLDINETTNK